MLLETYKVTKTYYRTSKLGVEHGYQRSETILKLRCDNCGSVFERPKSNMAPKRRGNHYFHVCSECDVKRFAQRKGVERKFIWDKPASSADDISKL
jgi:hypothetical protein